MKIVRLRTRSTCLGLKNVNVCKHTRRWSWTRIELNGDGHRKMERKVDMGKFRWKWTWEGLGGSGHG